MLQTIALISLLMFVNWQATPKIVQDDRYREFANLISSEFGGDGKYWQDFLFGIIRPEEKVLGIAGGAYVRVHDTSGGKTTSSPRTRLGLVVTNQRLIWLGSDGYLFWSLKNISGLSPIRRGDLHFVMSDGSRVQVALALWMLRKARIESVNATLAALMGERLQNKL